MKRLASALLQKVKACTTAFPRNTAVQYSLRHIHSVLAFFTIISGTDPKKLDITEGKVQNVIQKGSPTLVAQQVKLELFRPSQTEGRVVLSSPHNWFEFPGLSGRQ